MNIHEQVLKPANALAA